MRQIVELVRTPRYAPTPATLWALTIAFLVWSLAPELVRMPIAASPCSLRFAFPQVMSVVSDRASL